jgi:hypothetical protein
MDVRNNYCKTYKVVPVYQAVGTDGGVEVYLCAIFSPGTRCR